MAPTASNHTNQLEYHDRGQIMKQLRIGAALHTFNNEADMLAYCAKVGKGEIDPDSDILDHRTDTLFDFKQPERVRDSVEQQLANALQFSNDLLGESRQEVSALRTGMNAQSIKIAALEAEIARLGAALDTRTAELNDAKSIDVAAGFDTWFDSYVEVCGFSVKYIEDRRGLMRIAWNASRGIQ